MNIYPVQTQAQLSVQFKNLAGEPVDPTTVTLTLSPPNASPQVIDSGITRTGTGAYSYDLVVDVVGYWQYRWQGEGAAIVASPPVMFQGI